MSTAVAIVFAAAVVVAIKVSVGALERIARSIARVSSTLERLEGALPDGDGDEDDDERDDADDGQPMGYALVPAKIPGVADLGDKVWFAGFGGEGCPAIVLEVFQTGEAPQDVKLLAFRQDGTTALVERATNDQWRHTR
jgi:hypothetical protein